MDRTELLSSPARADRAIGAILGMAAGDALGAPYEFGPALAPGTPVTMHSSGAWDLGEWTDDTSMAIPILSELAAGNDLRDEDSQDRIVRAWFDWSRDAKDVGIQTRSVLRRLREVTAAEARTSSKIVHDHTGRSAGNGSLMRTAPVALGYLDDPEAVAVVARSLSDLTHFEQDTGDACVIWSLAIRHAVLTGEYDLRTGIMSLPVERRDRWHALITEAEQKQPQDFASNGWVVQALQGAWSAITHADSLVDTLERAVRGGRDADTVAAIAGSLAGAKWGASALPAAWRRLLHGWPGHRARDLTSLAYLATKKGANDSLGWPASPRVWASPVDTLVQHPHDDGLWLGSLAALDRLPVEVDAVVSLARVGTAQVPANVKPQDHVEFWLIDTPRTNPNLGYILADSALTIATLRAEGRTVFLHCAEGRSRTPTVAVLYSALSLGRDFDEALSDISGALPSPLLQEFLTTAARVAAEGER